MRIRHAERCVLLRRRGKDDTIPAAARNPLVQRIIPEPESGQRVLRVVPLALLIVTSQLDVHIRGIGDVTLESKRKFRCVTMRRRSGVSDFLLDRKHRYSFKDGSIVKMELNRSKMRRLIPVCDTCSRDWGTLRFCVDNKECKAESWIGRVGRAGREEQGERREGGEVGSQAGGEGGREGGTWHREIVLAPPRVSPQPSEQGREAFHQLLRIRRWYHPHQVGDDPPLLSRADTICRAVPKTGRSQSLTPFD